MFTSQLFWLLLLGSVAVYWTLPARLRMGALALVSVGYVLLGTQADASTLYTAAISTAALLAWSLAFYYLAPLATEKRMAGPPVRTVRTTVPELALVGASDSTFTMIIAPSKVPPIRSASPPVRYKGHRWILWALIGGILAYLGWFKYVAPSLVKPVRGDLATLYVVPLGISYFTFKFIHYAIEVARGNIKDRSLSKYLSYIFLFPTFTAGPIERFDHFLRNSSERLDINLIVAGVTRIIHGIIKKFFFAEMIFAEDFRYAFNGNLVSALRDVSTAKAWRIAIASYLYLYLEFSGYCDMALGACRLYGIKIMENFNFPLIASNIGDFWKRWHMTLSGWCQTYVYMPVLGFTRRPNLATYATFIAIGLWHGAAPKWITWGAYHATGLVIYQKWVRLRRKQKWGFANTLPWQAFGVTITTLFVSAGDLLTFAAVRNSHDIVRIMGKLAFLNIR